MDLSQKIKAILFMNGEALSLPRLVKILAKSEAEIKSALTVLESELKGGGLVLLQKENQVMLATAPDVAEAVGSLQKEELDGRLTRAALETLTIVAYLSPARRADIDFIRGVNSSFIIRNLLMAGLIERKSNPEDQRTYVYAPSLDLMRYLGLEKVEDLPEYQKTRERLKEFFSLASEETREGKKENNKEETEVKLK